MRRSLLLAALALSAGCAASAQTATLEASYPEGPLWRGGRLYYAEMGENRVSVYENGERRTFFAQSGCGPTSIAPYGDGFLILCHLSGRVVAVNDEGEATRTWLETAVGERLRDPNDSSADGHGGVYFSDPGRFSRGAAAEGYVMYLSADGALTRLTGPLRYPNGVHVAGDVLYVSEHLARRVLRYPIEAPGRLGEAQVFAQIGPETTRYRTPYDESGPDGLEFGPDGALHVAIYGEGRVLRFSATGALLGEMLVEPRYVTNVAFSESGAMAIVGAFENDRAPFRGEVRITPAD